MIDIATDSNALHELINMVLQYNLKLVEKLLEVGANIMRFGDDLGIQNRLPMSPEHFRKYLGPCYAKIFGACRQADAHVYLHTDGNIVEIMQGSLAHDNPSHLNRIQYRIRGQHTGPANIDTDLQQLGCDLLGRELESHCSTRVFADHP